MDALRKRGIFLPVMFLIKHPANSMLQTVIFGYFFSVTE